MLNLPTVHLILTDCLKRLLESKKIFSKSASINTLLFELYTVQDLLPKYFPINNSKFGFAHEIEFLKKRVLFSLLNHLIVHRKEEFNFLLEINPIGIQNLVCGYATYFANFSLFQLNKVDFDEFEEFLELYEVASNNGYLSAEARAYFDRALLYQKASNHAILHKNQRFDRFNTELIAGYVFEIFEYRIRSMRSSKYERYTSVQLEQLKFVILECFSKFLELPREQFLSVLICKVCENCFFQLKEVYEFFENEFEMLEWQFDRNYFDIGEGMIDDFPEYAHSNNEFEEFEKGFKDSLALVDVYDLITQENMKYIDLGVRSREVVRKRILQSFELVLIRKRMIEVFKSLELPFKGFFSETIHEFLCKKYLEYNFMLIGDRYNHQDIYRVLTEVRSYNLDNIPILQLEALQVVSSNSLDETEQDLVRIFTAKLDKVLDDFCEAEIKDIFLDHRLYLLLLLYSRFLPQNRLYEVFEFLL
ncbi:MAG: hypothetical protein ACRCXZ_05160 [Patescibacteria group bacterium]